MRWFLAAALMTACASSTPGYSTQADHILWGYEAQVGDWVGDVVDGFASWNRHLGRPVFVPLDYVKPEDATGIVFVRRRTDCQERPSSATLASTQWHQYTALMPDGTIVSQDPTGVLISLWDCGIAYEVDKVLISEIDHIMGCAADVLGQHVQKECPWRTE